MKKFKTIAISQAEWEKLMFIKIDNKLSTLNDVIKLLILSYNGKK